VSVGPPDDQEALSATLATINRAEVRAAIAAGGFGSSEIGHRLGELANSTNDNVAIRALQEIEKWTREEANQARGPATLNATFHLEGDWRRIERALKGLPSNKRREILAALGSDGADVIDMPPHPTDDQPA